MQSRLTPASRRTAFTRPTLGQTSRAHSCAAAIREASTARSMLPVTAGSRTLNGSFGADSLHAAGFARTEAAAAFSMCRMKATTFPPSRTERVAHPGFRSTSSAVYNFIHFNQCMPSFCPRTLTPSAGVARPPSRSSRASTWRCVDCSTCGLGPNHPHWRCTPQKQCSTTAGLSAAVGYGSGMLVKV